MPNNTKAKTPKHHWINKPTLELATKILGMKLTSNIKGKKTSGMIVEVEAYHGEIDQACHSYRGKTARNEVMFRAAGHCYVYFIYGNHFCVNFVTEKEGIGAAILIRALEPLEGLKTMKQRRKKDDLKNVTNGPGKLCQALAIDKKMSGEHFILSKKIQITPYKKITAGDIGVSKRIGISKSKDLMWRFYLKNNVWVSR